VVGSVGDGHFEAWPRFLNLLASSADGSSLRRNYNTSYCSGIQAKRFRKGQQRLRGSKVLRLPSGHLWWKNLKEAPAMFEQKELSKRRRGMIEGVRGARPN